MPQNRLPFDILSVSLSVSVSLSLLSSSVCGKSCPHCPGCCLGCPCRLEIVFKMGDGLMRCCWRWVLILEEVFLPSLCLARVLHEEEDVPRVTVNWPMTTVSVAFDVFDALMSRMDASHNVDSRNRNAGASDHVDHTQVCGGSLKRCLLEQARHSVVAQTWFILRLASPLCCLGSATHRVCVAEGVHKTCCATLPPQGCGSRRAVRGRCGRHFLRFASGHPQSSIRHLGGVP